MRALVVCQDKSSHRRRSKRRGGVGDRAVDATHARTAKLELRAEPRERDGWIAAATREGYLSLSDWCRDRLNSAARTGVHTSSARQTWNTPEIVIQVITRALGPIALDPCSNPTSIVGARVAWELERDGDSLARPWFPRGRIYVNPPYKRDLPRWVAKIVDAYRARRGALEIVALVPARTDARWWHAAIEGGALAGFWRGRLRFLGARTSAPFPSALLYWGERPDRFRRIRQIRVSS